MSPEQVRAERVDARSDVFSLGSVIHEMLSGQAPFARATSYETAFAIVHDEPPPLPDSALARVVRRCLEKDPAARFENAAEVVVALQGAPRRRRVRRRVTVIAAAMALTAAIGAYVVSRMWPRPAPQPDVIAVFPFAVRGTAQAAYLGEGMVDLLSTTLESSSRRAVDPHALLSSVTREKWSQDPEKGRKLAWRLGARRFVLGSIVEAGSRLRIHASIYDAGSGAQVREAKVEGEASKIFDLVDDLSAQILATTRGRAALPDRKIELAKVTTSSPEALKAYLEGMQHLRKLHSGKAREAFERAVAADPSFALAHLWLAAPGFDERAYREFKLARELSSDLPERDRKDIEAVWAFSNGKFVESERLVRELLAKYPDDFEAQLDLLVDLRFTGHMRGIPYGEVVAARERLQEIDPDWERQTILYDLLIGREFDKLRTFVDGELARDDESLRLGHRWLRALLARNRGEVQEILGTLRSTPKPGILFGRFFFIRSARLIPGGLDDAEAVARMEVERDPSFGYGVLAMIDLLRGRVRASREHLRLQFQSDPAPLNELALASWSTATPYAPVDTAQLTVDRDAVARFAPKGDDAQLHLAARRLTDLGHLSALLGDSAAAERAAAELEGTTIGPEGSTLGPDLALWIRGLVQWKAGRPADALALVEKIRGEVPPRTGDLWQDPWPPIRWAHAELLYQLGRYDEARRWFLTAQWGTGDWYVPPRLRRLAQIEELRGNREKAIRYYEDFVELWNDCDPELRPQVDEARARLAALKG